MYADAYSRKQEIRQRLVEIREELDAREEELEALLRELRDDRAEDDGPIKRRGHLRLIKGGLGLVDVGEPAATGSG